MDNLNSVVRKHQRSIKFSELRAEEIAFQNEKRQKHHQNEELLLLYQMSLFALLAEVYAQVVELIFHALPEHHVN